LPVGPQGFDDLGGPALRAAEILRFPFVPAHAFEHPRHRLAVPCGVGPSRRFCTISTLSGPWSLIVTGGSAGLCGQ
jgi:hypothetical protein